MTHSKYSPSKLPRIIDCPASTLFDQQSESHSSKYAEEGTLLHDYLARAILHRKDKVEPIGLNREQTAILNKSLAIAKKYYGRILGIEEKVTLDWLNPTLKDTEGTVDFIAEEDSRNILVLDWKFGAGHEVFAKDNPQLYAYAVGIAGLYPDAEAFTLAIYQPRRHGLDQYIISKDDLIKWAYKTLIPAISLARGVNPPFNPTDRACLWCNGKSRCKHRVELANATAEIAFKAAINKVDLSTEEIERLLLMEPFITKFLRELKAAYITLLNNKEVQPKYFKLVKGRSNRKWKPNIEEKLTELIDPELLYEAKIISPTKAERLVDDNKYKELTKLWYKPDGKPTLARVDDTRQSIESTAEAVFENYKKELKND